jgi:hypothetical protein
LIKGTVPIIVIQTLNGIVGGLLIIYGWIRLRKVVNFKNNI